MSTNSDYQQFPPATLAVLRQFMRAGRKDGVRFVPGSELAPGGQQYRSVAEMENAGLGPSACTVEVHLPALRDEPLRL
jgi:hypothetical protein